MTKTKKKPLNLRYAEALDALTPAQAVLTEIAAAARVSVATARAWIAGKQKPDDAKLQLLATHFGMNEDELFSPQHFNR